MDLRDDEDGSQGDQLQFHCSKHPDLDFAVGSFPYSAAQTSLGGRLGHMGLGRRVGSGISAAQDDYLLK